MSTKTAKLSMETIVLHTLQMETAKLILKFLGKTVSAYSIRPKQIAIAQTTIQEHSIAAVLLHTTTHVDAQPATVPVAKHAIHST